MKIELLDKIVDLDASKCLRRFETFSPEEWSLVKHAPKWTVEENRIVGGGPDEPTHGQVFCRTPVRGDVVLDFEARIIPPSYHDIVWFWNTRFDCEPWSAGYLGCLGGWWSNCAGIEKLPGYVPSAIASSHTAKPGQWYHIVSGSVGRSHFIVVDSKLVTLFTDEATPDPAEPGHFGFGVYESHAEYRNLTVWSPTALPYQPKYRPASSIAR